MFGLFVAGLRIKVDSNYIAAIRHIGGRHWRTSLPTGMPESISAWRFSSVIPATRVARSKVGETDRLDDDAAPLLPHVRLLIQPDMRGIHDGRRDTNGGAVPPFLDGHARWNVHINIVDTSFCRSFSIGAA